MTDREEGETADGGEDRPLARLAEQITRRLQSGDPVDVWEILDRHPAHTDQILALIPTLRELTQLGRASLRSHRGPTALSSDEADDDRRGPAGPP